MRIEKDIDDLIKQVFEEENTKIEVPGGLEKQLEVLIDQLDRKEKVKPKKNSLWLWVGSMAAAIALVVIAANRYTEKHTADTNLMATEAVSTIDDPEPAYEEAVKALMMVSANFNKGMEQLALAETRIDKVNSVLDKTFKDRKQ